MGRSSKSISTTIKRHSSVQNTWVDAVWVQLLELLRDLLDLLVRTAGQRPLQVRREMLDNVFCAQSPSVAGRTDEDQVEILGLFHVDGREEVGVRMRGWYGNGCVGDKSCDKSLQLGSLEGSCDRASTQIAATSWETTEEIDGSQISSGFSMPGLQDCNIWSGSPCIIDYKSAFEGYPCSGGNMLEGSIGHGNRRAYLHSFSLNIQITRCLTWKVPLRRFLL